MATDVGWQDRDWARWTDEERERIVGARVTTGSCAQGGSRRRVELTALAVAVSAAASLGIAHFHALRLGGPPAAPVGPAPPPVVYGTGLAHFQGTQELTCTAMESDAAGVQSCTTWQYLLTGQRAVQAAPLPAGGPLCTAVVADQATGRWKCTRGQLPASGSA